MLEALKNIVGIALPHLEDEKHAAQGCQCEQDPMGTCKAGRTQRKSLDEKPQDQYIWAFCLL